MKNSAIKNHDIWQARYDRNDGIAKWPYDHIVSMVMRRFSSASPRSRIKILDYGCGGGNNFWFLVKEGFSAFAIDVAPSAINMTKKRLFDEGFQVDDGCFSIIDGEKLPYEDSFFDAIIDRESLCQSPWSEIKSRVKEFERILAPGGSYLGVNFSCHHPDVQHGVPVGSGDWDDFTQGLFRNAGQRHLFSINEIVELFDEWDVNSVVENKSTAILGDSRGVETSEYIISAKKKKNI